MTPSRPSACHIRFFNASPPYALTVCGRGAGDEEWKVESGKWKVGGMRGESTDCHVAALLAMTGFLRGAVRVGRGVGDAAPYAEQEVRCAEVYGWPHR